MLRDSFHMNLKPSPPKGRLIKEGEDETPEESKPYWDKNIRPLRWFKKFLWMFANKVLGPDETKTRIKELEKRVTRIEDRML